MDRQSCDHRILLGGGGFSTESDPELDKYVLASARSPRPRICLIPTGTGDSSTYISKFERRYSVLACETFVLSLFRPHTNAIDEFLLSMDVIYVGGGNTRSMLAVWREWGLIESLLRANSQGCLISGVSAGLICWFESGITDSEGCRLTSLQGIGAIAGVACPHFDSEPARRDALERFLPKCSSLVAYGVPDGVALEFNGSSLIRAVSCRAGAGFVEYAQNQATGSWEPTFRAAEQLRG